MKLRFLTVAARFHRHVLAGPSLEPIIIKFSML